MNNILKRWRSSGKDVVLPVRAEATNRDEPEAQDQNEDQQEVCAVMKYYPLESGDIRVLEILQPDHEKACPVIDGRPLHPPHKGDTGGSLAGNKISPSCRISHTALLNYAGDAGSETNAADQQNNVDRSRHPFIALSYNWGDESDVDSIIMDGYAHVVQRNLKKALLALRGTDMVRSSGCRIWADALCIDQSNPAEVNREIRRMRHIYKEAVAVVVWLGDEADNSDLALRFINTVDDKWKSGPEVFKTWLRQELETNGTQIWPALSKLMLREYWSRLWIIQELTIGGPTAVILCGKEATTFAKMYQVYDAFHLFKATSKHPELGACFGEVLKTTDPTVYDAYRNVLHWQWEKCEDFQTLQDGQIHSSHIHFKRHLLTRCRIAMCRKPSDKVYGILGLLDDVMSAQVVTDYKLPVREVYMSFARTWIRSEGDLGMLIQCGETGEQQKGPEVDIEGLPSWAPNLLKEIKLQLNNFDPEFNSHGEMHASDVEFLGDDGSVLSTDAVLFDTLDGLSGTRYWDDDLNGVQDIRNSASAANAYGSGDEGLRTALWLALSGGRDRHGKAAKSYHECVLDTAILDDRCAPPDPCPDTGDTDDSLRWNLHIWLKRNRSFQVGGKRLEDIFQDLGVMKSEPQLYYQCIGRVVNWMWCRRLATTRNGYLAVVPRVARLEDVVAILPGCSCPLLLRPVLDGEAGSHKFEIVAECYVQGMMNGEVVSLLDQGLCHMERISIV
ncbi:uncharacterized protein PV06_09520 [Exophiala oligosperma]|uniref:Heterokaryon incompatibility domain-containing protein n=1 Tax=Exophiala oligosperma TaxID=215243 RepID=A0A0D2D835_9EURO|nr:uncharacterized protein PV06_09520 [Exophiala oligosperma]KIW38565.1 hypothetical protein PV06_09520 [Exophiala oligosperma]